MKRGNTLLAVLTATCLLLGLLPGTALAADAVVTRTTSLNLTANSITYQAARGVVTSADPTAASITDSVEGWSWDQASKTLTLSSATIQTPDSFGIKLPRNATIQLNGGTSTVTSGESQPSNPIYGVSCDSNLTIAGSGALTIAAGDTTASSYGVYADGAVTITGDAVVTAEGGAGQTSFGVCGMSGVTVSGSAHVNATGGDTGALSGKSYGIYSNKINGVVLEGSCVVTAAAGTAEAISHGIYAHDLSVTISGSADVTATGGAVRNQNIYADYYYPGSSGIIARKDVVISGGKVTANGGPASGTYGVSSGIRSSQGNITIKGTAWVKAVGGTASYESLGINVNQDFTVSDARTSVIATGGSVSSGASYGVYADGGIIISDGSVQATGGTAQGSTARSAGLRTLKEAIQLSGAAQVTATGGTAAAGQSAGILVPQAGLALSGTVHLKSVGGDAKNSYGVSLGNSSRVELAVADDALLEAQSGTALEGSFGVWVGGNVTVSGRAGVTAAAGAAGSDSIGIKADANYPDHPGTVILSSSGTVTATGGVAERGTSCGIRTVIANITDGVITANGEMEHSTGGYGIDVTQNTSHSLSISGGTVKAQGKKGGVSRAPTDHIQRVLIGQKTPDGAWEIVSGNATDYLFTETRPPVSAITLSSLSTAVPQGGTHSFSAKTVFSDNSDLPGLVDWTVTGGAAGMGTSISNSGLLTVDAGETGKTLIVTATSKANPRINLSVTVTVLNSSTTADRVTLTPETADAVQGGTVGFTAVTTLAGSDNLPANSQIEWNMTGGHSGTFIDRDGLLTIAQDESADMLTVTATSKLKPHPTDEAIVTVKPRITGVTLSPASVTVRPGGTQQFNATLTLYDSTSLSDNSLVQWTLTGNSSPGTSIDSSGLLTVAAGETASALTLTAQLRTNAAVTASARVTVSHGDSGASSNSSGSDGESHYTVTAGAGDHGSISPSGAVRVRRNGSQEFRILPDSGYEVYDVLVDGKSIGPVERYAFDQVRSGHTIEALFVTSFSDVAETAWYRQAVRDTAFRGILGGVGQGRFSPGREMSRAMLATVLYRMAGAPALTGAALNAPFTDVEADSWCGPAVRWAWAQDIVNGVEETIFRPDAPVTREQLVTMLYRYADSPASGGTLSIFSDADQAGVWATDALRWAVEQGLLFGKRDGSLSPKSRITRAEAAVILMRYLKDN